VRETHLIGRHTLASNHAMNVDPCGMMAARNVASGLLGLARTPLLNEPETVPTMFCAPELSSGAGRNPGKQTCKERLKMARLVRSVTAPSVEMLNSCSAEVSMAPASLTGNALQKLYDALTFCFVCSLVWF
jgi:hypothetical protein